MLKTAAMAFGLLALPSVAAAQSKAELDIGWLGYSNGMITQDLSVWNTDLDPIKDVKITCRFFRAPDQLDQLGAGSVEIKNIAPDSAGSETLSVPSKIAASSASIVSVER
jgi:hypothetical protein